MNAKSPQDLIEALESGQYAHGTGRLHLGGRFCCLGVASHLAGISVEELGDTNVPGPLWKHWDTFTHTWPWLSRTFDVSGGLMNDLWTLNDNSESFEPVIAYLSEAQI